MDYDDTPDFTADCRAAEEWARGVLAAGTALVLDSETMGLSHDAQIVELAVCDLAGNVLLDTRIKPTCAIPADASRIHGIYDHDVVDAPSFADVYPQLAALLNGRTLIIYNLGYDRRVLDYCCELAALPRLVPSQATCAMHWYSQYIGDWNPRWGNYKFQRLPAAPDVHAHSALGDCLSTLAVLKRMAGQQ